MKAPLPSDESERLRALRDYAVLDTLPEPMFDDIVELAAQICGTPISMISLVDENRQWFKAKRGVEVEENPRDIAFCSHVVHSGEVMVIPDATKDERFANNPLVIDAQGLKFYVGIPLTTAQGHALGTLCVADRKPRELTREQMESLETLARHAMHHLDIRVEVLKAKRIAAALKVVSKLSLGVWDLNLPDRSLTWSDKVREIHEVPVNFTPELEDALNFYAPEYRDFIQNIVNDCAIKGIPFDEELQIITTKGRRVWVRAIGEAVRNSDGQVVRVQGAFQNINSSKLNILDVIKRREQLLLLVSALQELFVNEMNKTQALQLVAVTAGTMTQADGVSIDLVEGSELTCEAAIGLLTDSLNSRTPLGDGRLRNILEEGAPVLCTDIETSECVDRQVCQGKGILSQIIVPVHRADGPWALMRVSSQTRDAFSNEDLGSLQILATALGAAGQRYDTLEALNRSEKQYRLLFASNPIPMWTYDVETLRFLDVNRAAVSHYGYTREEFMGMTILDIRGSNDKTPSEAAVKGLRSRSLLRGLRVQVKKNGEIIEAEVTSEPVEFNGKQARLALAQDVTESRRNHQMLMEQAALIDAAPVAIILQDMDHRIRFWSKGAETLYGWSADEANGKTLIELLQADSEKYHEAQQAMLKTGEWFDETRKMTKDGRWLFVSGLWKLLCDEQGVPRSVLSIDFDVTEQKKLEQQFLRAQRVESLGTLAGGIAHDLNNLLSPIVMGVELLEMPQTEEQMKRVIKNISESANRGRDLVKQVLSFARGVEGARTSVHLKHVVGELEGIMSSTFPKNIHLDIDLDPDLGLVLGDPTQLEQVLLNLCVNARDAMPEGGKLSMVGRNVHLDEQYAVMNHGIAAGDYVCLEVIDNGTGIPPEVLNRMFEPFFTTKEIGKGTGLGLSTVQGIIRSHGGVINAYSEVGKGCAFKIYLPVQEDDSAEGNEVVKARMIRGHGELILLVDDEVSILNITKQTLEAFGYRVETAEDGAQAVGMYAMRRDQIAVVFTDMMMPVMDGPALIAALRRIDPQVKVIAASGLNANDKVAKAANIGVQHFLPKPYSADAMLAMLHLVIHGDDSALKS